MSGSGIRHVREAYTFVTDSHGGSLLELNPGEVAGVDPLQSRFRSFFHERVKDHISDISQRTLGTVDIAGASFSSDPSDRIREYLEFVPGKFAAMMNVLPSRRGSYISADAMHARFEGETPHPHVGLVNGSRLHQALYMNKAVFAEVAHDAHTETLPKTRNYLAGENLQIDEIMFDFKDNDFLVVKPIDACQGKGVFVIPLRQAVDAIAYTAGKSNTVRNPGLPDYITKFWREAARNGADHHSENIIQVQAYAPGTTVDHKWRRWKAARRDAWTVVISEDEQARREIDIRHQGGFYKLPREPMRTSREPTQDSTVSFSYGHNMIDRATSPLRRMLTGRGDTVVIAPDEARMLGEPIRQDLLRIFEYADRFGWPELREKYKYDQDPVRRALATYHMGGRYDYPNVPRLRGREPLRESVPATEQPSAAASEQPSAQYA